jgi:hypothetical protein
MTTLIVNKEFKYPSGATYHVRCEAVRSTEMNADCYRVLYSINGGYFQADGTPRIHEYYAQKSMWSHHKFAGSLEDATMITLYVVESVLDTREHRQQNATLQTAAQRQGHICHLLRKDPVLQKLVLGMYPSAWLPSIRVQCDAIHVTALQEAIAPFAEGVTITWDTVDYAPRYIGNDVTERIPVMAEIVTDVTERAEDAA